MIYEYIYNTPDGFDNIILNSDGESLVRLYFENSKNWDNFKVNCEMKELPIFQEVCCWLDIYFSGKTPDFIPKYKIDGLTSFRQEVIDIISGIPFGKTMSYKDIAEIIARKRGIEKMSAQAVGGAVGWNPIGIIIPCHRVIGANGNLIGYGGGIENKIALLDHEKNDAVRYIKDF